MTVPLPVKGMRGLQDALLAWTQGEEVHPGKACRECGATSAVRHEETLLDLPPVLALQLQRFEAAPGSWGGTVKTRGRFAFPETLDVYPYTAEGKARRERDPGMEEGGEEEEEAPPREWYRLQGVLMHRGSSPQEGHYYSYARRGAGAEGEWWCLNDEAVAPFDVAREAERTWFQGGVDSPFILLYARDAGDEEAEAEAEATGYRQGHGHSEEEVLAAHLAAPGRLEALSTLVAGLAQSTLGGGRHSPPVAPLEVQRLLELFHWLAASAAAATTTTTPLLLRSGSDEPLHAVKSAGALLRRRLLEGSPPSGRDGGRADRERDALAVWVLRRLAGGWLEGVFAGQDGGDLHGAPLGLALRRLWLGVAEAALDRAASCFSLGSGSGGGNNKAEEAMDALAAAVMAPALEAQRGGELAVLVERLRPRVEATRGEQEIEVEFEDAVEDLDEEEEEPAYRGPRGGRGGGGGAGPFADAG